MMPNTSALSPKVLEYLEHIKGAPCLLERFLSSDDFKRMQDFAKDFGGIDIELPDGKYDITLNVFGVLTLQVRNVVMHSVTHRRLGIDEATHREIVQDFLSGIRQYAYPEMDSAWCAQVVIQAIYDATTAKVERAITRSKKV